VKIALVSLQNRFENNYYTIDNNGYLSAYSGREKWENTIWLVGWDITLDDFMETVYHKGHKQLTEEEFNDVKELVTELKNNIDILGIEESDPIIYSGQRILFYYNGKGHSYEYADHPYSSVSPEIFWDFIKRMNEYLPIPIYGYWLSEPLY
jgi:hypothetical protein